MTNKKTSLIIINLLMKVSKYGDFKVKIVIKTIYISIKPNDQYNGLK